MDLTVVTKFKNLRLLKTGQGTIVFFAGNYISFKTTNYNFHSLTINCPSLNYSLASPVNIISDLR
ncbi:hypothetical protein [Pontibacter populi]|uniref:Uncharacterized protein n=1 Tax=Pontibacter populi TaxID=890055 RepID=A0ABV1RPE6_9BACT